jgi:TonB-dependent starch-binding outer membrane protein SusC
MNKIRQKPLIMALLCGIFGLQSLFLFASSPTNFMPQNAADIAITGKVLAAENKEPLVGVSVRIDGTNKGVVTDVDGNFALSAPSDATLIFTFIGYETQKMVVNNQSVINVSLVSSSSALSELVVIGYGSAVKKDMTGAVKSLKSTDFNRGIINSPEQLLQGKVAGVNVTSASGEPGGLQGITIRGPGGVRTGSTPLFVLDGFALDNASTGGATNPLNFLNPQDIESIDVLKDASATAIYGSRGANGVILITTKKGKAGFSTMSVSSSYGISNLARPIAVFTADEFRNQVRAVGGTLDDLKGNTDWQKEITRTAITQNHNLSFGGGADRLTYYASLGLQNQEGILKGNQLNRYTGRINVNQKLLNDKLSIDFNLNATSTKNERPPIGSMLGGAITLNPTFPAYNDKGEPALYQSFTNPLISLKLEKDITFTNRIIGNISPSLTFAKGLVYKLNFGIDNATSSRDIQSLPNAVPLQDGRLTTIDTKNRNTLIENYLTYTMSKNSHDFTALVGHSYQKIFVQGRSYGINKFPSASVEPQYNPALGQDLTPVELKPSGFALENELQSFFGRANYQFKGKYLATATVRADGSSKFGANNKYGLFPSFSFGWRIGEEDFLKNSFFSDLKLRAGWGRTGNQEIPSKITQALFTSQASATASYPLYSTGTFPAGTSYTRLANPDIQWENSTQTDFGLDFGLFKGAISGTLDVFNKESNNILLQVIPADPVQPATTTWSNVPNMTITNKGVELELMYHFGKNRDFKFDIGGNITLIDNVVKNSPYSVIPSGSASGSGLTSATINGYINNQPIGTFFLREYIGIGADSLSTFTNVDSDPKSTDKDRLALGSALPTTLYNLNGNVSYKGFDLAINFNGVSGNKIYDNTANSNFYKNKISKGVNTTAEAVLEPKESINNPAPVTSRYLKDGAFLRLNNMALGYTFLPKSEGVKKWVSSVRLSITGQNLWVSTKYNGYDPEVNTDRTINGISSYGIDYLSYPKAKSLLFGLNIVF